MSRTYRTRNRNFNSLGIKASSLYFLNDISNIDPGQKVDMNSGNWKDLYTLRPELLGRGHFSKVYKAKSCSNGNTVAIKVIRRRRRGEDRLEDIMREVDMMQTFAKSGSGAFLQLLEHHITFIDVALVMEFAVGGSIYDVIHQSRTGLPEVYCKIVVAKVMSALSIVHNHNIVHLDIKPDNILLRHPYPSTDAVICDFGVARQLIEHQVLRELVGTPDYIAPEVANYEPITYKCDMWSMGVLCYFLLTNLSPFLGYLKEETLSKVTKGVFEFAGTLQHEQLHLAREFISNLLSKNPSNRMSAADCLQHEFLSSVSVLETSHGSAASPVPPVVAMETPSPPPTASDTPVRTRRNNEHNRVARDMVMSQYELCMQASMADLTRIDRQNEFQDDISRTQKEQVPFSDGQEVLKTTRKISEVIEDTFAEKVEEEPIGESNFKNEDIVDSGLGIDKAPDSICLTAEVSNAAKEGPSSELILEDNSDFSLRVDGKDEDLPDSSRRHSEEDPEASPDLSLRLIEVEFPESSLRFDEAAMESSLILDNEVEDEFESSQRLEEELEDTFIEESLNISSLTPQTTTQTAAADDEGGYGSLCNSSMASLEDHQHQQYSSFKENCRPGSMIEVSFAEDGISSLYQPAFSRTKVYDSRRSRNPSFRHSRQDVLSHSCQIDLELSREVRSFPISDTNHHIPSYHQQNQQQQQKIKNNLAASNAGSSCENTLNSIVSSDGSRIRRRQLSRSVRRDSDKPSASMMHLAYQVSLTRPKDASFNGNANSLVANDPHVVKYVKAQMERELHSTSSSINSTLPSPVPNWVKSQPALAMPQSASAAPKNAPSKSKLHRSQTAQHIHNKSSMANSNNHQVPLKTGGSNKSSFRLTKFSKMRQSTPNISVKGETKLSRCLIS